MSKGKKIKEEPEQKNLAERIKKIAKGLYYTSETDAEILLFTGEKAEAVDKDTLVTQTGYAKDSPVEERNFEDFFSRLTEIQNWFGEEEKESVQKFLRLKELLLENLKDLKVFKVGTIELDIYVVGLDSESVLMGIKTKAVET